MISHHMVEGSGANCAESNPHCVYSSEFMLAEGHKAPAGVTTPPCVILGTHGSIDIGYDQTQGQCWGVMQLKNGHVDTDPLKKG